MGCLLMLYGPNIGLTYDIGYAFETTLMNSLLAPHMRDLNLCLMVGSFHGHAHNWQCQLIWHSLHISGMGHSEGEDCKHIFLLSNNQACQTWYATRFHWHFLFIFKSTDFIYHFVHNTYHSGCLMRLLLIGLNGFLPPHPRLGCTVLQMSENTRPSNKAEVAVLAQCNAPEAQAVLLSSPQALCRALPVTSSGLLRPAPTGSRRGKEEKRPFPLQKNVASKCWLWVGAPYWGPSAVAIDRSDWSSDVCSSDLFPTQLQLFPT